MTSEDLGLERLQRAMASAVGAIGLARAAAPEESSATDTSGSVEVYVDRVGRPVGVRIADDWSRRVDGEALAGAVLEAAGRADAALGQSMSAAIADLKRTGEPIDERPSPVQAPQIPDFDGVPRPLLELAELAVADLGSSFDERAAAARHAVHGRAGDHVSVRLGPAGLLDCTIDARWAGTQSGVTLSTQLSLALADAAAQLRDLEQKRRDDDTLLAEAFAHLRALAPRERSTHE